MYCGYVKKMFINDTLNGFRAKILCKKCIRDVWWNMILLPDACVLTVGIVDWLLGRGNHRFLPVVRCLLCVFCSISWEGHLRIHRNWCLFILGKCKRSLYDFMHLNTELLVLLSNPFVYFFSHYLWLFFQALSVFILYVRCTGIDPADPGILVEADNTVTHRSQNNSEVPG